MAVHLGEVLLDQLIKDFHLHTYSNHLSVVIEGQDVFDEHSENPES